MNTIDRVKEELWKTIRTHQKGGGKVRNGVMENRFGGTRGLSANWGKGPPECACLLGVVGAISPDDGARLLGISYDDAAALESGFEGWNEFGNPFYKLGREIGQQLEDEEAARRGQ